MCNRFQVVEFVPQRFNKSFQGKHPLKSKLHNILRSSRALIVHVETSLYKSEAIVTSINTFMGTKYIKEMALLSSCLRM